MPKVLDTKLDWSIGLCREEPISLEDLAASKVLNDTFEVSKIEQVLERSQLKFSNLYTPRIDFVLEEFHDNIQTIKFQVYFSLPQVKKHRLFCHSVDAFIT